MKMANDNLRCDWIKTGCKISTSAKTLKAISWLGGNWQTD